MRAFNIIALRLAFLLLLPVASLTAQDSKPGDEFWDDRFGSLYTGAGVDGDVFTIAVGNGELYVGGSFTMATEKILNNLGRYDGKNWHPVGEGTVGVNGPVFSIGIKDDKVYVAGNFSMAGDVPVNNIAVWNITSRSWSALGAGLSGGDRPYVASVAVVNDSVFVGGQFTTAGSASANNVALWNGTSWSGLGVGVNGTVNSVCFTDRVLYAGGNFSSAGGQDASAIARWNGQQWRNLGAGVTGYVNVIHPATALGGGILVGGVFTAPHPYLVRFIDENWYPLSSLIGSAEVRGPVRAIALYDTRVFIGGTFTATYPKDLEAGSDISTPYVARYDGIRIANYAWNGLRQGTNGYVNALAADGSDLYVGGEFTNASGVAANHIARWDQRNWYPLGAIIGNAIRSIVVKEHDVYVGWNSTLPGSGLSEGHIVRWSADGWTEIDGMLGGELMTLVSRDEEFFAGGAFVSAREEIAVNVARWNSASERWSALTLGSGVAGGMISYVDAVAADDRKVYVGGAFTIADTLPAWNVAVWDRTTDAWSALGAGLNGVVRALVLSPEGDLYAGGEFTLSGADTVRYIARWDGAVWRPLGRGPDGPVLALAIDGGELYVAGDFDTIDGVPMNRVARWSVSEQAWHTLGEGVGGHFNVRVSALTVYKHLLYAAGSFFIAGSDSAYSIARWDGSRWTPLGSGLNSNANALAVRDGEIFVGGSFSEAGAKPSLFIGLWHEPAAGVAGHEARSVPVTGEPNPSRDRATIRFHAEAAGHARLTVSDMLGRHVATLIDETVEAGDHAIAWDASGLPAGIYSCLLSIDGVSGTTTLTVVR